MELGFYTFGDVGVDPVSGRRTDAAERLKNLLEEIELADQLGLDVFALGEHHRADYAISSPSTVLAAAAARTGSIRLSSAVTVLSSEDPVRVFQQYATLDLLSRGRAEIMAGRGSFIESFPLFGHDLEDYDNLFAEKLDLLLKLREGERITWPGGRHTPKIDGRGVYPRPLQDPLPVWIAIGGTPQSAARAGMLGLPLALAIIGGEPHRFAPLFDLYRKAARQFGHDAGRLATSINVHGFVGETTQAAADTFFPPVTEVMNRIGRERGWGLSGRREFDASMGPKGALFVGSPAEVTDKILASHEIFGNTRFLIQMAIGTMPHRTLMKAIELFGLRVAPEVRKAVGGRGAVAAE